MAPKSNRRTAPTTSAEAPARQARRHLLTAKDLQVTALINGTKAVKALHATKGFSKDTLATAAEYLLAQKNSEELGKQMGELLEELFPGTGGSRGRAPVSMGETREYKNILLFDGDEVKSSAVRVPTDLYPGVTSWEVTFEKGSISLVPKKS